jgi:hypothetical protein
MKYMTMVSADESQGPPPPALMGAIMQLGMEAAQAGVLVQQGGLHRSNSAIRVRVAGGRMSVTDGPFAESKELIGGYAIYSVKSRDEIIHWTERFMALHLEHWPGWTGMAEVREIYEAPGQ